MAITFVGNIVDGSKVGISVPKDADLVAYGNIFHNVDNVIQIKDSISLLDYLKLPHDTPQELIVELFKLLVRNDGKTPEEQATSKEVIKDSCLWNWLTTSYAAIADFASLSGLVLTIQQAGGITKALALLGITI